MLATGPLASALEALQLQIADVQAPGWLASGINARLSLRGDGAAELSIAEVRLPAPVGTIKNLRAHCARTELDGPILACDGARIRLDHPWLGGEAFGGDVRFDRRDGRLEFALREVPVGGGRAALTGHWQDGDWKLRVDGRELTLASLQPLLPPDYQLSGRVEARLDLAGRAGHYRGRVRGRLLEVTAADPSGRFASEALELSLQGAVRGDANGLDFNAGLSSTTGQFYVEPVFVDTGQHPLRLEATGRWQPGQLELHRFAIDQPSVATAAGTLRYETDRGLTALTLDVSQTDLGAAYALYAQPFLIGTPLDNLRTQGWAGAELRVTDRELELARLDLADAGLEDAAGRFGLSGLSGSLRWQARAAPGETPPASRLSWNGGHVRGMTLGAASLPFRVHGRDIELLEPTALPVLDGALAINELRVREAGTPAMSAAFDAELRPIDMRRFSQALGWPVFAGQLAGRLPSLSYEDGRLTVGGQLTVEAFGGRILVEQLELNSPFGTVPRLSANIYLRDLDLKAVTDTFAFGRIEGRLSGEVERLRLLNWLPAAFDARFYTPPDDRSRHRISQRAIQNISDIGGGGAGAILSRGFLRFFEDFSYDRIGISCRLIEDVCLMGGLGPAAGGGGYYLVKGAWLPRVDVIGFQREVSWPTLLEQLRSVTATDGPIVK